VETKITGTVTPVLEVDLNAGEMVLATTGQMSWMTPSIQMKTTTAAGGSSGFFGGLKRALGGGGLFMTEYSAPAAPGHVSFAAHVPGQIVAMPVEPARGYMVHRHGFMCGTSGVQIGTALQRKLGVGIFGGVGFVLQHVTGTGTAWLELGGEIVERDLAGGESLLVHPGHIGAFDDRVTFDVETIKGVKNALFGGEGIFVVRLTGPGRIWLQTLTVPGLAHALVPYLPKASSSSSSDDT